MRRIAALFAAAVLLAPMLQAQEAEKKDAEKKPKNVLTADELAAEQTKVRERLSKIEETMKRIGRILEKDNPDQAARLKMAWDRSRNDRNLESIKEIEDLLKEEYFQEAFEKQKNLEVALQRLLEILLDQDAERKDLKEKIERLEDISQKLEKIIADEREQFHNTEKFANPEKSLQRVAAAKAKLGELIKRQQEQIDRTKDASENATVKELRNRLNQLLKDQKAQRGKSDAAKQKELADKAEQLAKDIAKHAQEMPDAMKAAKVGRSNPADQAAAATQRAGESMGKASEGMQGGKSGEGGEAGKSPEDVKSAQRQAEQDLREAQDALRRLADRHKQNDRENLAKKQERIRKDTQRLQEEIEKLQKQAKGADGGAGDLGKAQGDMSRAESKLNQGNRPDAVPHEQNAKKELEKAMKKVEELEKELKRLIELPDYEKAAKDQENTEKDTADLLKKMEEEGKQDPSKSEGEGSPGQSGVQGAKKAMQQAKKNLRGKSAKRANRDQREAIERLEKAREELEEALRQLREEEQLMLLEALERRLVRMLQKQTKLFRETLSLSIRRRDVKKAPRALVDKGRQLGDGEAELAVDAEKVLDILREEGTSVVIPDVMVDLKADLENLAKRLRKLDAGDYTRQVQQDVMETLRDLIEVIKEELNRRQGEGGGGQDGSESDPDEPLLPTSAELKMLKALQVRVNKRTSTFDRMREKSDEERGHIAKKQKAVGTLTRTMADRLNREEDQ